MPSAVVDGNDVLAVRRTAAETVSRARAGEGPTLIEAKTYRHKGHSRVDPGKYRPKEEVDEWLGRDPLPRLAERLDAKCRPRVEPHPGGDGLVERLACLELGACGLGHGPPR